MAEIRHTDGSSELLGNEELQKLFKTLKKEEAAPKFFELMANPAVKDAVIHKSGAIVEKDGKAFMLTEEGIWREIVKMVDGSIYFISETGKLSIYKGKDC